MKGEGEGEEEGKGEGEEEREGEGEGEERSWCIHWSSHYLPTLQRHSKVITRGGNMQNFPSGAGVKDVEGSDGKSSCFPSVDHT